MQPREFRIVIAGRVGQGFAAGLDGVKQRLDGHDTILEGDFIDQSHLRGLLDQMHRLGFEVTSFSTFSRDD